MESSNHCQLPPGSLAAGTWYPSVQCRESSFSSTAPYRPALARAAAEGGAASSTPEWVGQATAKLFGGRGLRIHWGAAAAHPPSDGGRRWASTSTAINTVPSCVMGRWAIHEPPQHLGPGTIGPRKNRTAAGSQASSHPAILRPFVIASWTARFPLVGAHVSTALGN